jgi:HK97 family phage major capsid protein
MSMGVKNATQLVAEMNQIWDRADHAGRDLTMSERTNVQDLLLEIKAQKNIENLGREIGLGAGMEFSAGHYGGASGGPGDMFVRSEGFKRISDPGSRPQSWSTGAVEVSFQTKAGTVLESGQGSGFTLTPQVIPGAVSKLFEYAGVADVFAQGQATTSSVRYVTEGTATNSAAGVAEGGVKPASDLAYSTIDEPVKKIATVLTISDELLEDAVQIQTYLNSRLSLFVSLEEERQLLRGAGTNELVGVFGRSGINTYTKLATDDNATGLARVLANTAGSSFLTPDTIIMHPSNWLATRILRDGTGGTVGQFYGGGPFTAAYGGGAAVPGLFGQSLWNTKVVLSSVVGAGTALVGNFQQGAQIWRRGNRTVEASNQHASYFQSNLVMIRAESRAALAVYRPVAFTEVRGLA